MKKKTAHYLPKVDVSKDLMICLVAGGAGFIGSHLCESLLGQNCFVYCLDNFSTGRDENIKEIKKSSHFQVLERDLVAQKKLNLPQKVDYIFHIAGAEAYFNGLDVSMETLLVNAFGTKVLLELAKENKAKFLLVSSNQVYEGFISEQNLFQYFGSSRTMEGEGAFAEAKRFAEALTFEYFKKHQVNSRIVRLDFLYGPRMNLDSGNILAKMFKEAIENEIIHIPGNGLTRLYPTYISDAVYGLVKAIFSRNSKGRVFNLTNPHMVTILNFAHFLRDQLEGGIKVEFVTGEDLYNFDFPQKSVVDSQTLLGWYPRVETKEGVVLTLNWLSKQRSQKNSKTDEFVQLKKDEKQRFLEKQQEKENQTENHEQIEADLKEKDFQQTELAPTTEDLRKKADSTPSFITSTVLPNPDQSTSEIKEVKRDESKSKFWKTQSLKRFLNWFNYSHWIILGLCLLLLVSLLPIILFAWTTYRGIMALKQIQPAMNKTDIEMVAQYSSQARQQFHLASRLLQGFSWATTKIGLQRQTQLTDKCLRLGGYLTESIDQLWIAYESGQKLMGVVLGTTVGDSREQLQALQSNLIQTNTKLGFAEAELASLYPELLEIKTLDVNKYFKYLHDNIPVWRQFLSEGERILTILPAVLQFNEKQTYLVLLQNNQELRPTGGFIGSYALVTLEKGQILDFTIEDIYTADGQLKGYVEPPEPIKKYLGEDIWWFRDSNISPNFPTSAARAVWFLQKEMNREVTGVIGANLELIQNILEAIGPVYVTDYKEQISANNVFERAEYHAEVNFFPGSTQKRDFLGSLSQAIFENTKHLESDQTVKLAQAIIKSLNERALMIWLPGANEAKLLDQYGWSGSLRTPPNTLVEFGEIHLNDYLMPVEANFGVNKANYFIKRESQQEVTILKDGNLKEVYTLTLTNNSPSDAWPGGRYKNYFRLYLPDDIKLETVKISKTVGETGETLNKKDIEAKKELGKAVVGLLIEIPAKEKRVVTVTYRRNKRLPLNQSLTNYLFYWQKQSGLGDNPVELIINYPIFLQPKKISDEAVISSQSLKFTTDLNKDRLFVVTFSK